MSFAPADYLDLEQTEHAAVFDPEAPVWMALNRIASYLDAILDAAGSSGSLRQGEIHKRATVGPLVFVAPGAVVESVGGMVLSDLTANAERCIGANARHASHAASPVRMRRLGCQTCCWCGMAAVSVRLDGFAGGSPWAIHDWAASFSPWSK